MRFRTTVLLGGKTATGLVVPPEVVEGLAAALTAGEWAAFDALSPSRQKAHVTSVEGARTPTTRARRLAAVRTALGT